MSDHLLELVIANLPNAFGIAILIVVLIKRSDRQDELLAQIVKRLLNHKGDDET